MSQSFIPAYPGMRFPVKTAIANAVEYIPSDERNQNPPFLSFGLVWSGLCFPG